MIDSYCGVFDYYRPGCGCEKTLVMSGTFSHEDLYNLSVRLRGEGII